MSVMKRMALVGGALVILAWAVAPALAQETPRQGGILRVGQYHEPTSLDPHVAHDPPGLRPRNHIFEGLVTWDEHTNPVPMLTESWKASANGKLFTFTLRKGVKFHNGQELTSEDVVWSLDRFMKLSARRGDLRHVSEVNAVDRYTVEVALKEATPTFIPALSQYFPLIMNKEASEAQLAQHKQIVQPVGTGPFKLVEWKRGQYIRLERFNDYVARTEKTSGYAGRKVAYLDQILWIPIPDNAVRVLALEKGEIDYAEVIPYEDVTRLKSVKDVTVGVAPGTWWSALYFNTRIPPFDKLDARRAVAAAINYQDLIVQVFAGYGRVANSLIPDVQRAWRTPTHARTHEFNPGRAKELLKKAGYDGSPIVLESVNHTLSRETGDTLFAQLRAVGLNVDLKQQELGAHLDSMYQRSKRGTVPRWHMSTLVGSAFRPDPHFHYGIRVHSKEHPGWYKNPRLDALIEEASKTLDTPQRIKLYDEAQKIVMDEVPLIVLNHYDHIDAYQNHLRGVRVLDPFYEMFWNVWIGR